MIELNRQPSRRDLLWFGVILFVFFGVIGAVARFRFDAPTAGAAMWYAGGVVTAGYFAVDRLRVPIYLGWMRLFFPLGWTISHLVLVVLYFAIMMPIGLLMRIGRYDPLCRRKDPDAPSFWQKRKVAGDSSRYLRQF
ncbi:MAG: SxtJ family membrane protein [Gemmatimonadota bacterium]|nr:SxtJ family membrane protein [Gemmatimonadota bacterium]